MVAIHTCPENPSDNQDVRFLIDEVKAKTAFTILKSLFQWVIANTIICPECGLESGTVQSDGYVQRAIVGAFRNREAI
jgi:hypothetical protein